MSELILDTGPLVAFFDADDQHHEWAVERFKQVPAHFITCEAVITEAFFLLGFSLAALETISRFLADDWIRLPFQFLPEHPAVMRLMRKYHSVPMSFADACLVRMSEKYGRATVITLDDDFLVYRRNGRQIIPVLLPD